MSAQIHASENGLKAVQRVITHQIQLDFADEKNLVEMISLTEAVHAYLQCCMQCAA